MGFLQKTVCKARFGENVSGFLQKAACKARFGEN